MQLRGPDVTVAGVDLTADPGRRTWISVLRGREFTTFTAARVNEVAASIAASGADLAAIDAPLSLPPPGEAWREEEREMMASGLKPLPLKREPMRRLAMRGIALASLLEDLGVRVVETHPSSARKVLKIGVEEVKRILGRESNRDEVDAVTAALTGALFLGGSGAVLGGRLVLPSGEGDVLGTLRGLRWVDPRTFIAGGGITSRGTQRPG